MSWRGKTIVWCFAALVAVRVVVVGVTLAAPHAPTRSAVPGDVRRYHQIARGRGTPYADFAVEYPPVTLAAIDALDARTVRETAARVMWTQLVLDLAIAAIIAWGWGRRAALLYLVLGLAFIWFPFLYLRLDLVSVALAVGGLALVRRRQAVAGGALVAVACFAKIWPVALAPGMAVRRSWRAAAAFAAVGATGVALWVGWAGWAGPVQVLTFRGAKGWQIESTVGAVIHAVSNTHVHMQRGSLRIGIVPGWARIGLPLLGFALVGVVWALVARIRRPDVRALDGVGPLAAVTAMLVCATIVSPQYVSWLLPFAAIAAAGGERAIGWLTGIVAFLSTASIALAQEVGAAGQLPMVVILVRNLVMLALLVTAVVRLVRLARPADHEDHAADGLEVRLATLPSVLVARVPDERVEAPLVG